MTRPDTCGAAGGAVVLWVRMTVDLTGVNGAVFSSEEQQHAPPPLLYLIRISSGRYQWTHSFLPRLVVSRC